jgi:hypothetical protein
MSKLKKQIIIFSAILVVQLVMFSDYISIFSWDQIKVKGLACTCPDEKVISGVQYLKSITPDSLKKYNLEYSEIFVSERPSAGIDYMGVNEYVIKGEVVGKKRVSNYDPWNPYVKVTSWREVISLEWLVVHFIFIVQLIIYPIIVLRSISQLKKSA